MIDKYTEILSNEAYMMLYIVHTFAEKISTLKFPCRWRKNKDDYVLSFQYDVLNKVLWRLLHGIASYKFNFAPLKSLLPLNTDSMRSIDLWRIFVTIFVNCTTVCHCYIQYLGYLFVHDQSQSNKTESTLRKEQEEKINPLKHKQSIEQKPRNGGVVRIK